jgi:hypothetical protein
MAVPVQESEPVRPAAAPGNAFPQDGSTLPTISIVHDPSD